MANNYFKKVCRTCLADTGPFKDLFLVCTPEVFKYCTAVEISEADNLPKQICQKCIELLNKFFCFKHFVQRNNEILKQQAMAQVKVKMEETSSVTDVVEVILTEMNDNNEFSNQSLDNTEEQQPGERSQNQTKTVVKRRRKVEVVKKSIMQCPKCDKSFRRYKTFQAHIISHLGNKQNRNKEENYMCVQCGKKFAQPGNLKMHLIRHTGVKNFACQLCDMRFYVKSDLFNHMRSHSSDKPYSCELCDKSFKKKNFQTVHMRTHTGERPYACDLCPKRFMTRKDLRSHRMIHTGEKPHKCTLCTQAFIQKCALNRHMKVHYKNKTRTSLRARWSNADAAAPAPGPAYSQWNQ